MDLPDRQKPLERALASLRTASRSRVPFGWRLAARRGPALVGWLASSNHPRGEPLPHLVAQRSSPLARAVRTYSLDLQRGKEHNVARVVELLDGLVLVSGATASWSAEVGPPLRIRGFVDGPELHDGVLGSGVGGGACQVANLLLWLAVHSGLEVVERHRHTLDLFPDDHRDVPFGLGATVFWPTRDLVLYNPLPCAVHLALACREGRLWGQLTAAESPAARFEVVERDHRFERAPEGVVRCNRLFRVRIAPDGTRTETLFAEHRARVLYPVPSEVL